MLGKSITMAVLVGLSCLSTAHASVVYNWTPTGAGDDIESTGGQLILTDAAYRRGTIDYDSRRDYPSGNVLLAVLKLNFGWVRIDTGDRYDDYLGADLTVMKDGGLKGTLDMFGVTENLDAAGEGKLWTSKTSPGKAGGFNVVSRSKRLDGTCGSLRPRWGRSSYTRFN